MEFDKIVKKLSKMSWDIVDQDDLLDLVDPGNARWKAGLQEVYKLAYSLKSRGILRSIKNGLSIVISGSNSEILSKLTDDELIEKYYWKIVRKIITRQAPRDGIIMWAKSLELHLKDESIPDILNVYTSNISKVITISSGFKLQFKTIVSWKKSGKGNLIPLFLKLSERIEVDEQSLRVAGKELSLLDALLIHKWSKEVDEYLIKKFIKRHSKAINRNTLGLLVSKKYVTSANRLRALCKEIGEESLYQKALDTIKVEGGGCFLSF